MEKHVNSLLGISTEKIKAMADVNMVLGDPVTLADDITIVPISHISYGFAAGGSDLPNKANRDIFGGGSGAGINVKPVALLIVSKGEFRVVPINAKPGTVDQAVSMIPDVIDKVKSIFTKEDKAPDNTAEQVNEITIE